MNLYLEIKKNISLERFACFLAWSWWVWATNNVWHLSVI